MKMLKALSLTTMMLLTSSAMATDLSGFKLAVIKNSVGSTDIIKGEFTKSIKVIQNENNKADKFELAMGLCVAHLKTTSLIEADNACSNAIKILDATEQPSRHVQYLKALALSNRAIVRYIDGKIIDSHKDFVNALGLSEREVVKNNFNVFKDKLMKASINELMSMSFKSKKPALTTLMNAD